MSIGACQMSWILNTPYPSQIPLISGICYIIVYDLIKCKNHVISEQIDDSIQAPAFAFVKNCSLLTPQVPQRQRECMPASRPLWQSDPQPWVCWWWHCWKCWLAPGIVSPAGPSSLGSRPWGSRRRSRRQSQTDLARRMIKNENILQGMFTRRKVVSDDVCGDISCQHHLKPCQGEVA